MDLKDFIDNVVKEQQHKINSLEERINLAKDAEKAIHKAIAKAQGEIEDIVKDADNPFYNSRYASPAAINKAIKKPLADNGLYITHNVECDDTVKRHIPVLRKGKTEQVEVVSIKVTTRLQHVEGCFLSCSMTGDCENNIQQKGSIITYCKRYNILSLLNLAADEDDDGNCTVQSLKCEACGMDIPRSIKVNGKDINYPEYSKKTLGGFFCLSCGKAKKELEKTAEHMQISAETAKSTVLESSKTA